MAWYGPSRFPPYVPVAQRRARAQRQMNALRKKGADIQPVEDVPRQIATTFWGAGWCRHLEGFSDFENRLPRGRTYVRNGSVCHLAIHRGKIEAKVAGSSMYTVTITIKQLAKKKWAAIKRQCGGRIGSLVELLEGRLSDHVMEVVTDPKAGLFPLPGEIKLGCSCPDWAVMCKHVAAVLYGVGARLDHRPELLFTLRGVNHDELITADAQAAVTAATTRSKANRLASADISDVFGIDLADSPSPETAAPKRRSKAAKKKATKKTRKQTAKNTTRKAAKKTTKKKATKKKATKKKATKKKATKKKATKKKATPKKATKKKASAKKTTQKVKKSRAKKTTKKKARDSKRGRS